MADDPTVRWQLAIPSGIEMDAEADAWHSGHVNDILQFLDLSEILVASATGGVWLVDEANDAISLSQSWDTPDVKCLALGTDGPRHVFAGCTVAYDSTEKRFYQQETGSAPVIMETDAAAFAPLLSWSPIPGSLPATAGSITRIIVIRGLRRIVVSCAQVRAGDTGGIFWARIPPTRFAPGDPPRPPFEWRQAKIADPTKAQGFWDLEIAATHDGVPRDNLEDRRVITLVAGGFAAGGLLVGQWDSADDLVFKRPSVHFDDGSEATSLLFDSCGSSAVSCCNLHPATVYATCAWPDGTLNSLLLSKDGGRSWGFCAGMIFGGGPFDRLAPIVGDQGKGWNNCIAAHPDNPGIAALGWQSGPYLTFDAGATWRGLTGGPHSHSDLHTLRFAIEAPDTIGNLFVGSDGGVVKINLDDLDGVSGPAFRSNFNRNLATLQCYSMLFREFTGTVDISSELSGILVAGLQDNGNVSARFRPTPEPWRHVEQGDGGWNAFVQGGYVHSILDGATIATAPLSPDVQTKVVPITLPAPGDPAGLKVLVGEAVMQPAGRNPKSQLLVAVASSIGANTVFGLYAVPEATPPYEWQILGAIPSGESVSGLASVDGNQVFIGTGQGKIYLLNPADGTVTEQPIKLPKPSPSTRMKGGSIPRLVGFSPGSMFAFLFGSTEARVDGTDFVGTPTVRGFVLRLDGNTWSPTTSTGLPIEFLYGFVAVAAPNSHIDRGLLAATDDAVFISRDEGANWQRASLGLPRRPHCADLRFAIDSLGGANVVLGTFGRSMWIANLLSGPNG